MAERRAPIGVVGGSGFYEFVEAARRVEVTTPYGRPSEAVTLGEVAGVPVAFLPRHGADHRFPPHRVPYRANLWALRSLGVRQVLAPSAVGSLVPALAPGRIVVPDSVIDRTWGRPHTYCDTDIGVAHVGFADPYCPRGRRAVLDARPGDDAGGATEGGTLVVINGPRFSSRAESRWHASMGASVVGMTGMPEAALARELALCYTCIALVTDYDAGIAGGETVTAAEVLRVMASNITRLRALLASVIPSLPLDPCVCTHALDGQRPPYDLP